MVKSNDDAMNNVQPQVQIQNMSQDLHPGSALWLASRRMQNGQGGSQLSFQQPKHISDGAENFNPPKEEDTSPLGLTALCSACSRLYPNQPNPLQVTARVKYWLGGPDPLDYISMYWNQGNISLGIPPHWHYISFGLSDLHGDGRVHPPPDMVILTARAESQHLNLEVQSGYGLEMTFRLLCEPGTSPPMWPAALLQALARYVFKTGNRLCVSDHISWHSPLDGSGDSRNKGSRLRHMLVSEDPQLGTVETPLGSVQFVQIVGATARELRAAQAGRGQDVLDVMAADPSCGGRWHITNMNRVRSARGLTGHKVGSSPSDLAGVSAVVVWSQWVDNVENPQASTPELPQTVKEQIKNVLQKGLSEINASFAKTENKDSMLLLNPDTITAPCFIDCKMSTDSLKIERACTGLSTDSLKAIFAGNNVGMPSMSTDSFEMSRIEDALIEEVLQSEIASGDCKLNVKIEDAFSNIVKTESDWETDHECLRNLCQQHCPGFNQNHCSSQVTNNDCQDCQADALSNEMSEPNWCVDSMATNSVNEPVALKGVHIIFNAESGSLLPLALRGRVACGRHFTWRSSSGNQAVTVLSTSVSGAFVSERSPYMATRQGWLQVLLPQDFALEMADAMRSLSSIGDNDSEGESSSSAEMPPTLPAVFAWPSRNIKITVTNDEEVPVIM